MLFILWALFNALVFCLVFWLAYQAIGMVRDKFGWAASIVLMVGLLSFMNAPKEKEEKNVLSLQASSQPEKNFNQISYGTVLEKFPLFALHLNVICDVLPDGTRIVPEKAWADQNGFVMAHRWRLNSAVVNYNAENKTMEYNIDGTIKWNLLGITFYAQSKNFVGTITGTN